MLEFLKRDRWIYRPRKEMRTFLGQKYFADVPDLRECKYTGKVQGWDGEWYTITDPGALKIYKKVYHND